MTLSKSLSRTQTHIRCGSPECDRGAPFSSFDDTELTCRRREFRDHCIQRHGLDPNDADRVCWFDLEALTLTLLDD